MYQVYGDIESGNCFKVKMLLDLLDIPYEWIHVDILNDESQTDDFLKMSPLGKIPLLRINEKQILSESNAILNYLAENTPYLPQDKFEKSQVLSWQFFEQYSHEPYIAVARFINKYLGLPKDREDEYRSKQVGGHKALRVMEEQLIKTPYLVGESLSIADISLYAYTRVAHEGGFDLSNYPKINAWIRQINTLCRDRNIEI